MATYLERYLAGEYERVWDDLVTLGAQVRDDSWYSDAMAVARETMRRARDNIEVLIARLHSLGYQFGYDWWDADFREMLKDDPPPQAFALPRPNVQSQLAEVESRVGSLPLSLHAWYEQVGAVNFVGLYPLDNPTDPNGFTSYIQFVGSGAQSQGKRFTQNECSHDLDPLFVDSLDSLLRRLERKGQPLKWNSTYELDLAPDEWLKYGVSGGGSYVIRTPNQAADAPFEYEWHDTTFVNYLRICFAWGGFPGLQCKSQRPEKELAFLLQGLLPL